jgi:heme exporter protein B
VSKYFFPLKLIIHLRYELFGVSRRYQDLLQPLLFLIMAVVLFSLGTNLDPSFMAKIAAGIFWVIVLFLLLLTLEQLFREDWQEGELEQLSLNFSNLLLAIFIKLIVFSVMLMIVLTIMAPILSLVLYIPLMALKTLLATLWLGVPTLIFLGGIARVLTLGLCHSSLLVVLLVLPFYIPVLIFASGAVALASIGSAPNVCLAWLAVLLVASVSFSPFIISGVVRLGINTT